MMTTMMRMMRMMAIYLMVGEESHGKFGCGGTRAIVAEVVHNNQLFIPFDNDSIGQ
jgi:hypothetical protein